MIQRMNEILSAVRSLRAVAGAVLCVLAAGGVRFYAVNMTLDAAAYCR